MLAAVSPCASLSTVELSVVAICGIVSFEAYSTMLRNQGMCSPAPAVVGLAALFEWLQALKL